MSTLGTSFCLPSAAQRAVMLSSDHPRRSRKKTIKKREEKTFLCLVYNINGSKKINNSIQCQEKVGPSSTSANCGLREAQNVHSKHRQSLLNFDISFLFIENTELSENATF